MSRRPPSPLAIWREFHWAFFLDVQGLIICLQRFETFLQSGRLGAAEKELVTASTLLASSAAAMELAAAFPREDYENAVRVSMTPPSVASENFSGLMSWEHAVLLAIWRRLSPSFAALPSELANAHAKFVSAYKDLASSHTGICERFVGENTGSLRYGERSAVETLRRFGRSRLDIISPDDQP
ncbi:siderophore biosynthesis protein [Agrobacterium vitis]|uniref:siderophore biosynthesis protein n=1 Tax=Rhizobium/Agrobacterium group TaxID=227290 RepID=UPI0012E89132|nr:MULTISPECIES: siderophore biosynthesis protein [Rhizobium/Agrobacterium group]MCF1496231.1 siderophore biosynthesis protein [Allorhizobium ampelinum]MVA48946.1 siderophore biosynthesis protein [Agrobacterium vitis]